VTLVGMAGPVTVPGGVDVVGELADLLGDLVERHSVPGAAVAVITADRLDVACAGVTNLEQPLPIDPDTVFQLASITKTMTSTAVARLVLDGAIDLDTRVAEVVPDFRLASEEHAAGVRVVDLLTHHGGFDGDEVFAVPIRGPLASVPSHCDSCRLLAPPGDAFSYGNAGYAVLGALIEHLTGEPFIEALRRLALAPAGIDAAFGAEEIITRRVAVAHLYTPDGPVVQRGLRWHGGWDPLPSEAPSGGAIASITTLGRWQATIGGGDHPLPSKLRELLFTHWAGGGGFAEAMGLGWMHLTVNGQAAVYHRGDYPGYHSDALCIPSLGFAVAGFTNGGPVGPRLLRDLRRHVLAHDAGLEETDPTPDTSADALRTVDSVVGTYDAWQAIVHVQPSTRDGQLRLRLEPRPAEPGRYQPPAGPDTTLARLDEHRLIINDPNSPAHGHPIDILRDPDGATTAIRWNLRLCPRRPDTPNTTR